MSTIRNLVVALTLDPAGFNGGLRVASAGLARFTALAAGAAAAGFVAFKVGGFIKDAVDLAARYETLGVVLGVVGRNAGKTREEMNKLDFEVRKEGIAMIEARLNLIRMAQAHLDLTKAAKLAKAAQNAAVIANITSAEAFTRVVHGIQTGRPVVLQHIGIMVNFRQAYDAASKTLDGHRRILNATEKANIRMNEVLRATAVINGVYEASFFTAGKQIRSTVRYMENMKVVVGQAFLPSYTKLVFGYANALQFLGKHASVVAGVVLSLTAVFTSLAAVLTGGAIVALFAFLGLPGLPIIAALTTIAGLFYLIGKHMGDAARASLEWQNSLQNLPEARLDKWLKDTHEQEAVLRARIGTKNERGPTDTFSFKRISARAEVGPFVHLIPTTGDKAELRALKERERDLLGAKAEQVIAKGVTPKTESAAEADSKAALARLALLKIEGPKFIEDQNKAAAAFRNAGVAAGEYQEHLSKVNEEVFKAQKGLTGKNAEKAAEIEGDKQAAAWNAELAKRLAEVNEQRIIEVRAAGQSIRSAQLYGRAIEEQARQVELANKIADVRRRQLSTDTADQIEESNKLIATAHDVFDAQEQVLKIQDRLAPWKAALDEMGAGFTSFFSDLVTNSSQAFSNLKQSAQKVLGAIIGGFAKRKFEVEIAPRIAKLLGFGTAQTAAQLASAGTKLAGDTMLDASFNMLAAANLMAGTSILPKGVPAIPGGDTLPPVAVHAVPKLQQFLGGATIAAAGFGIGSMVGGLSGNKVVSTLGGAASGAAIGALIAGTIVPVIGHVVGAVIGGIAGAIGGFFGSKKKAPLEIDTLIRGLQFDSTKIQSLAELQKKQRDIQKKLRGSLDLTERIDFEEQLKKINDALGGATNAVNAFKDAMYNVPEIFKVALAGFDARNPDFPSVPTSGGSGGGGGGGGGTSGDGGGGGKGFDNPGGVTQAFNITILAGSRSAAELFDEVEAEARRRSLARFGSTAGVGLIAPPGSVS